jgi:hypothetical protein
MSVIYEVFKAVTMKNAVFLDVTLCGSCKNPHFGGTYSLHHRGDKTQLTRNSYVAIFLRSLRRLVFPANVPS